jgi:predicted DNA-binding protein YlxM (UPF0122 family)
MALLLDFYGELLTETQREYMDLYYNEDFYLAGIARPGGITPQGVRDVIQRGEATLLETERKTGLMARVTEAAEVAARIRAHCKTIEANCGEDLSPLFREIDQDLDRICTL